MVMEYKPSLDAGLGLIYRLNNLWAQADTASINGEYDDWNNTLDAIWRNLSYREPMEFMGDGSELKIDISKKDKKGWRVLNKDITISKRNWMVAKKKNPKKIRTYWARRYYWLQMKDLFLRKKMFDLNLYLKVTEKDISKSTFGTFGK